MEIESKYLIPDQETFEILQTLKSLAAYSLKEPATRLITDTYLDTESGALHQAGYAGRIRHDHTRSIWFGTLKGLGSANGSLHQREEYEVPIMPSAPPRNWPRSDARNLALRLGQGQPFVNLFSLRQLRHTRNVYLNGQWVAELSLDQVSQPAGSDPAPNFELEIELKGKGTLDDLRALTEALAAYHLQPQPLSKFERAYAANVSIIK